MRLKNSLRDDGELFVFLLLLMSMEIGPRDALEVGPAYQQIRLIYINEKKIHSRCDVASTANISRA